MLMQMNRHKRILFSSHRRWKSAIQHAGCQDWETADISHDHVGIGCLLFLGGRGSELWVSDRRPYGSGNLYR